MTEPATARRVGVGALLAATALTLGAWAVPAGAAAATPGATPAEDPGPAELTGRLDAELPGDNPPLEGADVELLDADDNSVDQTTTDADGEYVLEDVAPGEYTVVFSADGFASDTQEWEAAEGDQEEIIWYLSPMESADLDVTVVDPNDEPVEGATVSFNPDDIEPIDWVGTEKVTPSSGTVSFVGAPVGEYNASAAADEFLMMGIPEIELFDGDVESREIELTWDSEYLVVEVVDEDGTTPMEGVDLTVEGPDEFEASSTTPDDGEYAFLLEGEGEYTITAAYDGYETQTVSTNMDEGGSATLIIDMEPLSPTETTVDFVVTDSDDDPIEGAEVKAVDPETDEEVTEHTDESGYAEVTITTTDADAVVYTVTADGFEEWTATGGEIDADDGAMDLELADDPEAVDPVTDRVYGGDRIETAAEIATETFDTADTVILATGGDGADALAATSLASVAEAPLLLTWGEDEVEQVVLDTLDDLEAEEVVIIGQFNAVSYWAGVELANEGYDVQRVGGDNRYETAALIADEIADRGGDFDEAIVAASSTSDPDVGWPDALSAGSYAALGDVTPVLLVDPDELPEATEDALDDIDRVEIVGGPNAVSDAVKSDIDDLVGDVDRISGSDRYETNVEVVAAAVDAGADTDEVWVATGTNWPDGLAAGAAAADAGTVVLLVHGQDLERGDASHDWFADERPELARVAGGTTAVSDEVFAKVADR